MTAQMVIEIGQNSMTTALLIAGPLLGLSLVVGLVVSVFQAVTQINEATLTFVPKILAIFVTIAVLGAWMMDVMVGYTNSLFQLLPHMVR